MQARQRRTALTKELAQRLHRVPKPCLAARLRQNARFTDIKNILLLPKPLRARKHNVTRAAAPAPQRKRKAKIFLHILLQALQAQPGSPRSQHKVLIVS